MRRTLIPAAAIATLALAGCGATQSHSVRSTPWTALVSCLRAHPLFAVYTGVGNKGAGSLPNGARRNIQVWQNVTGHVIAGVGDYGTPGAARAAADAYDAAPGIPARFHATASGALVYQWSPDTSSVNRSDVLGCAGRFTASGSGSSAAAGTVPSGTSTQAARPARSCPGATAVSRVTSCSFAQAVMSAFVTSGASVVQARSPVTGKTYTMRCAGSAGVVTCVGGVGASVSFAAPPATSTTTAAVAPVEMAGSYSHSSDAAFCQAHTCIASFPNGNGTIVQCVDGAWSHSGGLSGACSGHGGEGFSGSATAVSASVHGCALAPSIGSGSVPNGHGLSVRNMTCSLARSTIKDGHLVSAGGFTAHGWSCMVLRRFVAFGTVTGATDRCVSGARAFRFSWAT